MKRHGAISMRILLWGLAVALVSIAILGPVGANAAEMSTETLQLLPPGAQACSQPAVSNFIAYTYEGSLHSFEFTVSDPSYVAILGSVGGNPIHFKHMGRLAGPSGSLKVHVDIPTTRISGSLPLVITMISPGNGTVPVCALTVHASVTGPVISIPTPDTRTDGEATTPPPAPVSTGNNGTSSTTTVSSGTATRGSAGACSIANVSALWVIGLALYALLVASLVLGGKRPYIDVEPRLLLAFIAVPLLAIAGLWFLFVACRVDWAPLTALAIAIAGTIAAYRNDSQLFSFLKVS